MKTSEKKKIIEDLHEKLLRAKVVILSDYKGLDVSSINNLRRNLRADINAGAGEQQQPQRTEQTNT